LEHLPPELGKLENLCYLNLYDNELHDLPSELGKFSDIPVGEPCLTKTSWFIVDNNALSFFPQEIVAEGSYAVLDYLNNRVWWHLQRLLFGGASFAGIAATIMLGLRWRQKRGKAKKKNG
jgi:hypothetical protein